MQKCLNFLIYIKNIYPFKCIFNNILRKMKLISGILLDTYDRSYTFRYIHGLSTEHKGLPTAACI